MKIHPKLDALLLMLTSNIRQYHSPVYTEWCNAGKPVTEEASAPAFGFTGLMRTTFPMPGLAYYTPEYGDYLVDALSAKDARIKELEAKLAGARSRVETLAGIVDKQRGRIERMAAEGNTTPLADDEHHCATCCSSCRGEGELPFGGTD